MDDPYANYVKTLQERGMRPDEIRAKLLSNGLDQQTVDKLVTTPLQQQSADPVPRTERAATVEVYTDYIKALLARGISWRGIEEDLAARGLDALTRAALLQIAAKAVPSPSYPAQSQAPSSNGPRGQAPITLESQVIAGAPPTRMLTGWLVVIVSCLIPTLVIMFDAPRRFDSSSHILLTFAGITATIGLVLFVVNLVLATRIKLVEDMFGGLNRVYVAHAIIGGAALAFILAHPVLLVLRYMPADAHAAAALLVPTRQHINTAYGIFGLAIMLVLLMITFYIKLPYKTWLLTHKFLGLAFLLIALHTLFEPNDLTDNLFIRLYLITMVVIGLAAYTYRSLLPNLFVRRYLYVVQSAVEKTKGVIEVTLRPADKAIKFEAGQFIFISFLTDGVSPEWHPFTVSSPPNSDSLSIDVKSLGGYTETITRILPDMVGMTALIEGAYGRFSFRNFRNMKQVWIAGGIGITPFLSMAQSLGNGAYDIDLYYTVRSEAELIDLDKLVNIQSDQPGKTFRVIPFVSEKYNRYLTADLVAATTSEITMRDFLICGPPTMMKAMRSQLLQLGVSKYKIHTEEFSIT